MAALNNDDTIVVSGNCVRCEKQCTVNVRKDDLEKWKAGRGFIQDLMPYLSAGDREFLISRICSDCFDAMFPPEEEDDDSEEA
jgi:hypothetical protein